MLCITYEKVWFTVYFKLRCELHYGFLHLMQLFPGEKKKKAISEGQFRLHIKISVNDGMNVL